MPCGPVTTLSDTNACGVSVIPVHFVEQNAMIPQSESHEYSMFAFSCIVIADSKVIG